jgi:hypothetical protein
VRTVAEAIDVACAELGVTKEDLSTRSVAQGCCTCSGLASRTAPIVAHARPGHEVVTLPMGENSSARTVVLLPGVEPFSSTAYLVPTTWLEQAIMNSG